MKSVIAGLTMLTGVAIMVNAEGEEGLKQFLLGLGVMMASCIFLGIMNKLEKEE